MNRTVTVGGKGLDAGAELEYARTALTLGQRVSRRSLLDFLERVLSNNSAVREELEENLSVLTADLKSSENEKDALEFRMREIRNAFDDLTAVLSKEPRLSRRLKEALSVVAATVFPKSIDVGKLQQ